MYAIYGNIYHQYTPVMLPYIAYMDPMGYGWEIHALDVWFAEKNNDLNLWIFQLAMLTPGA